MFGPSILSHSFSLSHPFLHLTNPVITSSSKKGGSLFSLSPPAKWQAGSANTHIHSCNGAMLIRTTESHWGTHLMQLTFDWLFKRPHWWLTVTTAYPNPNWTLISSKCFGKWVHFSDNVDIFSLKFHIEITQLALGPQIKPHRDITHKQ